jgi:flavin reductase (DIM6/NTAB) family NADH-FMN oxidoreductase RutF
MPMLPVSLNHASRLVNFGPTVLVSCTHEGRRNLMSAAWSMPVEFTPPRIAVVIDKNTWTCDLIKASGTLALSVPCRAQADLTWTVGSVSGRDEEIESAGGKFAHYGIDYSDGPSLGMPLVAGCIAWLEARVLPEPHAQQAYDTFFVEVVAAWADERVFRDGRWQLQDVPDDLRPIHHLGSGVFTASGKTVTGRMLRALK